uniref:Uncharacterized protein n=1 Tax=Vespula pensylvanica TaxID=30213 RepID=A0A834UD78_VESPE|nr:hypothetical protein H0235_005169 [Vespula pensylvanica]
MPLSLDMNEVRRTKRSSRPRPRRRTSLLQPPLLLLYLFLYGQPELHGQKTISGIGGSPEKKKKTGQQGERVEGSNGWRRSAKWIEGQTINHVRPFHLTPWCDKEFRNVLVRTGNESAAAVQEAAETVLDNWPRVVENVREARSPRDNTPHAVS